MLNVTKKDNLFLVGYRCTGKTTVGKRLASMTARQFVDTDDCFVARQGVTIALFVADHGWNAFRDRESVILKTVSGEEESVIATGGGIVLRPENMKLMKARGLVIWLTASPETIYHRLAADPASMDSRPGLTGLSRREEIDRTLAERQPLYRQAMDFSVDTDNMAVDDICRLIINQAAAKG